MEAKTKNITKVEIQNNSGQAIFRKVNLKQVTAQLSDNGKTFKLIIE